MILIIIFSWGYKPTYNHSGGETSANGKLMWKPPRKFMTGFMTDLPDLPIKTHQKNHGRFWHLPKV